MWIYTPLLENTASVLQFCKEQLPWIQTQSSNVDGGCLITGMATTEIIKHPTRKLDCI